MTLTVHDFDCMYMNSYHKIIDTKLLIIEQLKKIKSFVTCTVTAKL